MDREAIEHARRLRSTMQAAIDAGLIRTRQQLLAVAASNDLSVTRNGRDYAGFLCKSGKRLRVRFDFKDRPPPGPEKIVRRTETGGYWIYSLTAQSDDGIRKACYIGQAANLRKRLREHFNHARVGHSSYALFEWAKHEQVEVRAAVLTWVAGTQSNATYFEGYWLERALMAGFEAPDVQNWGRLPEPESLLGQPMSWPETEVQAKSIPLADIIMKKLTLQPLCAREAPPHQAEMDFDA
ncbi:GIY-YIG nuclease family protein [Pseudomonas capeferrum]|uniref:GIY-YIG nuclease family protein n=1 Tax=Pseudomonas capeferrum TaxID=1495066 RepID=UPI0015E42965|nr:GIY-YIG nuclease family protein [Pseudomonas capeferrum]MBA1204596.1 GIY-YIG nuclease family protein [Pseudomonas capeferrum]